jgi:hypothetical protein
MKLVQRITVAALTMMLISACASGPQVTLRQSLSETASVPYDTVLVIALFSSFDSRRYLEEEVADRINMRGSTAIPSTSMMDTRTPVVAQTFIDMVRETGADAVVLTQLTSHGASKEEVPARPQATYNYWPTYYFNVFEVQLTEYVEPPRLNIEHSLVLATQVISAETREPVWGIEASSIFTEIQEDGLDYSIYTDEADAIVRHLRRDGLIRDE